MATYEMTDVDVKQIPDDVMRDIKAKLEIESNLPVLALAFKRDGTITVVRAEGEFKDTLSKKQVTGITKVIPGCILTAQGSTLTDVTIGGAGLTNILPENF